MGKQEGTMFVCDRAASEHANGKRAEAFLCYEDKAREDWHEVEWRDTIGVTIRSTLCQSCYDTFMDMQKDHACEDQAFMYKGL